MLYGDQSLGAWRLYPDAYDRFTHLHQQSVAMPEGFLCGDSQRQREPSPHESLLLFKRSGRELILLDKITARDGSVPTGIEWRGVERLTTNFERIEDCRTMTSSEARLARNAWTSGLISTLQLTRLQIDPGIPTGLKIRGRSRRRPCPALSCACPGSGPACDWFLRGSNCIL